MSPLPLCRLSSRTLQSWYTLPVPDQITWTFSHPTTHLNERTNQNAIWRYQALRLLILNPETWATELTVRKPSLQHEENCTSWEFLLLWWLFACVGTCTAHFSLVFMMVSFLFNFYSFWIICFWKWVIIRLGLFSFRIIDSLLWWVSTSHALFATGN